MNLCKNGLHDKNLVGMTKDNRCIECYKFTQQKFNASPKRKIIYRRYAQSEKGKISIKRKAKKYRELFPEKERERKKRFMQSPEGRYSQMKSDLRKRMKARRAKILELELLLKELSYV